MKKIILALLVVSSLGIVSCESNKGAEEKGTEKTLVYTNDSTEISWVAYKTTAKKGVKGQFTAFEIEGLKKGKTPVEVFSDASFVIQTNSVKTGNEVRDDRIVAKFFNVFVNTATITGRVKSLNETSGILEISLNEKTNDVPMTVVINGNTISLEGEIDLDLFNGKLATDSLNVACGSEHKGKDGITKLWPDVKIRVATTLIEK